MRRIPLECFPKIIGKGGANLKRIETETNTSIKILRGENIIKIFGDEEGQRKAAIRIKETAVSIL